MDRFAASKPKTLGNIIKYFCYIIVLVVCVFYLLDVPIQNDYLRTGFGWLGLVATMYLITIGVVEKSRR